jgi:hypothetical protein
VGELEGRGLLKDPGVDGRMILKWIFRNLGGEAWTWLIWLRIGTGGGLLWTRWWAFCFKVQGVTHRNVVTRLVTAESCSYPSHMLARSVGLFHTQEIMSPATGSAATERRLWFPHCRLSSWDLRLFHSCLVWLPGDYKRYQSTSQKRRLARSSSRRPLFCLAIPAFDRIAGLNTRHFKL